MSDMSPYRKYKVDIEVQTVGNFLVIKIVKSYLVKNIKIKQYLLTR